MKKKMKVWMLFLLISSWGMAQTANGSIKGKVLDESGSALIGANVYLEVAGNARGGVTDLDGNYHIREIPAGVYNLRFSFIGYGTRNMNGVEVTSDKISFVKDVKLGASDTLEGFDVIWTEPLIDMDNPSKISKTFKDLKHSPNIRNAAALIQGFSPEIKMSEDGSELYFRGGRSSASVYFVDGVKTDSPGIVPGVAIGSMSVYTGGVPAKYGDTTGGVVVMETKSYFDLYNIWVGQNL